MGGIVSITKTPKIKSSVEDRDWEGYSSVEPSESLCSCSKRIAPSMLSFPLQNKIQTPQINKNEPIHEGDEDAEERPIVLSPSLQNLQRQYRMDENIRRLELQLMKTYEKWDIDKRRNHEDSIEMFQRFNGHSCHI
jgi:hypothetical protein